MENQNSGTPPRTAGTGDTGDRLAVAEFKRPDIVSIDKLETGAQCPEIMAPSIIPVSKEPLCRK